MRLTTYHDAVPLSRNLGALTSWTPLGLHGLLRECFTFTFITDGSAQIRIYKFRVFSNCMMFLPSCVKIRLLVQELLELVDTQTWWYHKSGFSYTIRKKKVQKQVLLNVKLVSLASRWVR